jgi:hypothetical protein
MDAATDASLLEDIVDASQAAESSASPGNTSCTC